MPFNHIKSSIHKVSWFEFLYKTTDYWYPEHERSLLWCDPTVGIQWPVVGEPKLAAKDAAY
jgi:dTDP-4-dehydrorhamnose 3,5-epimerase